MTNSQFPVPITKIENALPGPFLDQETVTCFEQSYSLFVKNKLKQKEADKILGEIANLLTVSQNNLNEVQNQQWFERAWFTITGKNKKLEIMNQENLLKVQKGALFFLQNLAEINVQLMETVTFALQRVEDIQIENVKLKGYLIQVIQKYNKKIDRIEQRLDKHENAIADIRGQSALAVRLSGLAFLLFGTASFFFSPPNLRWILTPVFLLISVSLFVYSFIQRRSHLSNGIIASAGTLTSIQKTNKELQSQINDAIRSILVNFVKNNLLENAPIYFYSKYKEIVGIYNKLNNESLTQNQDWKSLMKTFYEPIFEVEPLNFDSMKLVVQQNLSAFFNFQNNLVSNIQQNYLTGTVGIDVLSSLDSQDQNEILNTFVIAVQLQYSVQFESVIKSRQNLLNLYQQMNQKRTAALIASGLDGFLDGFTLGLYYLATKALDIRESDYKEKEYEAAADNFFNAVDNYKEQWDNLASIIQNAVIQLEKTYDEAISKAISKMQPLFKEFDQRNISLEPLLKELKKG